MHSLICALLLSTGGAEPLAAFPELPELKPLDPNPTLLQELEEPKWTGSVAFGAWWSGGNTRATSVNALADAELRREKDRTTFGLQYAYKEEYIDTFAAGTGAPIRKEEKTEDAYSGFGQYDYFLTEQTYWLAQARWDTDTLAKLRRRITAGAGIGRQFREDEDFKLNGEAGLAWIYEQLKTGLTKAVAARLAYNLFWAPAEAWEVSHTVAVYPAVDNIDDYFLNSDARVRVNFSEAMFGQLQYLLDHDNTPAAGTHKTDHKLGLTVGWSF
jgi:putative salt-induced outer membrane protein YdiY